MSAEKRGSPANVLIWEAVESVGLPDFACGPAVYDEFPLKPVPPIRRKRRVVLALAGLASVVLTGCGSRIITLELLPAPARHAYVEQCDDPGRSWCGGNVYAVTRYVPDGHFREDGSIPTSLTVAMR